MHSSENANRPSTTADHKRIPLVETFGPTIQGEGSTIGLPTYFLRFGLCDYHCKMCDSMHAVDPKEVKRNALWLTQTEIFQRFETFWHKQKVSTPWVTFSGGNPCIHDLSTLVGLLKSTWYKIAVETQGTFCPAWLTQCDVVTVSPKGPGMGEIFEPNKFEQFIVKFRNHRGLNVKVVVFDEADIAFAAEVRGIALTLGLAPDKFFLSQGNPYPPGQDLQLAQDLTPTLRDHYLELFAKLQKHAFLCDTKFLPQFHVWLFGNRQGV